jgi:hypothetical protein
MTHFSEQSVVKVMVSSGQSTSQLSGDLQSYLNKIGCFTYHAKFFYEKEKEEFARRVLECDFLVILADRSWCESKKCQFEFSCALKSNQSSQKPSIVCVLLEESYTYDAYPFVKDSLSELVCIDGSSANASDVFVTVASKMGFARERAALATDYKVCHSPSPDVSCTPPSIYVASVNSFDCQYESPNSSSFEGDSLQDSYESFGTPSKGNSSNDVDGLEVLCAHWSMNLELLAFNPLFQETYKIQPGTYIRLESLIMGVTKVELLSQLRMNPVVSYENPVLAYDTKGRPFDSMISFKLLGDPLGAGLFICSYQQLIRARTENATKTPINDLSHLKVTSLPLVRPAQPMSSPAKVFPSQSSFVPASSASQESFFAHRLPESPRTPKSRYQLDKKRVSCSDDSDDNGPKVESPKTGEFSMFRYTVEPAQRKRLASQVSPPQSKTKRKYNPQRWREVEPADEKVTLIKRLACTTRGSVIPKDSEICIISSAFPEKSEEILKASKTKSQRPLFMMTPADFAQIATADGIMERFDLVAGNCLRNPMRKRNDSWKHSKDQSRFHFYQGPSNQ